MFPGIYRGCTRTVVMVLAVSLLFGCGRPEGPQEVTEAFWQALAEGDVGTAVELSTLADSPGAEPFGQSWQGVVPDFGRVVIDGTEATIVTGLAEAGAAPAERRDVMTYLVQREGQWLVDYERTADAVMNPSPLTGLMGQINRLGDRLSEAFGRSSDDLSRQMDQMAEELKNYSTDAEREAREAMKSFGKALDGLMQELEESIDEALKKQPEAPKTERTELRQASYELSQGREQLDESDFESLADASRALSKASARLASASSENFAGYQGQWREMIEEARERTQDFFEELKQSL